LGIYACWEEINKGNADKIKLEGKELEWIFTVAAHSLLLAIFSRFLDTGSDVVSLTRILEERKKEAETNRDDNDLKQMRKFLNALKKPRKSLISVRHFLIAHNIPDKFNQKKGANSTIASFLQAVDDVLEVFEECQPFFNNAMPFREIGVIQEQIFFK